MPRLLERATSQSLMADSESGRVVPPVLPGPRSILCRHLASAAGEATAGGVCAGRPRPVVLGVRGLATRPQPGGTGPRSRLGICG